MTRNFLGLFYSAILILMKNISMDTNKTMAHVYNYIITTILNGNTYYYIQTTAIVYLLLLA